MLPSLGKKRSPTTWSVMPSCGQRGPGRPPLLRPGRCRLVGTHRHPGPASRLQASLGETADSRPFPGKTECRTSSGKNQSSSPPITSSPVSPVESPSSTNGWSNGPWPTRPREPPTHVVVEEGRVIGFYSLVSAVVAHRDAQGKDRRNMPDPIPAVMLARMAVDQKHRGQGLGGPYSERPSPPPWRRPKPSGSPVYWSMPKTRRPEPSTNISVSISRPLIRCT